MKMTRPKVIAGLLIALTVIALAGAAKAYFTDHSEKINTFTSGDVDIVLKEEKFESSENIDRKNMICPNEKIVKDPKITNVGKNDCYVFMEFIIPVSLHAYVDSDGNMHDPLDTKYADCKDAFLFTADKNWVLVKKEAVESQVQHPMITDNVLYDIKYIYAYAKGTADAGEMIPLKKGETTSCVFADEIIQYGNFIEPDFSFRRASGQNQKLERDYIGPDQIIDFGIPVKAYAIQTFDIYGESIKKDPISVYNIFTANLKAMDEGVLP